MFMDPESILKTVQTSLNLRQEAQVFSPRNALRIHEQGISLKSYLEFLVLLFCALSSKTFFPEGRTRCWTIFHNWCDTDFLGINEYVSIFRGKASEN